MNLRSRFGKRVKANRHVRYRQPKGYYEQTQNPDHHHPRRDRFAVQLAFAS